MSAYLHYSLKLVFIIMLLFYLCKIAASDILCGKIKNIHILRILEISAAYFAIIVFCKLAGIYVFPATFPWIQGYFLFLAVSAAISIALWRISVWPAGDSKLHIAVSAAAPLVILNNSLTFNLQFNLLDRKSVV